jgi:hypothetical protein
MFGNKIIGSTKSNPAARRRAMLPPEIAGHSSLEQDPVFLETDVESLHLVQKGISLFLLAWYSLFPIISTVIWGHARSVEISTCICAYLDLKIVKWHESRILPFQMQLAGRRQEDMRIGILQGPSPVVS